MSMRFIYCKGAAGQSAEPLLLHPAGVENVGATMGSLLMADVDAIEELRLRCWAREHYVPPEQRDRAWHPIVLEEMTRKDGEVSDAVLVG